MGISGAVTGVGGWTVGPVVGRRPAGVARDAVHPGTGARAVLVIVDGRFTSRGLPDPETVARAAIVGSPAVMPMLDAGLLEDGTRWYVTPAAPGPVLDPAAGCSPRRAAAIAEAVAHALAAVHGAGMVHGLVGPQSVIPAVGRHAERPVSTTLLLDTGVAALLGDRADDLAAAAGVSLPADRGAAADVHALGALLLRMLTAAAPAGPALAALPVELRALLSAMLDQHPSSRPTADAVARQLAGLREGLLATGPVAIQRPAAPQRLVSTPIPEQHAAADPVDPTPDGPRPDAAVATAPRRDLAPRLIVPAPVPAPHTLESPITVPRSGPDSAPSLWTGSIPTRAGASVRRPRRRGRGILLLAGGVGLAGLLVGVVTHLPLGHVGGDAAIAAVAEHSALVDPSQAATGSPSAVTAATKAKVSHGAGSAALVSSVAASPAFVRSTKPLPSPLAAATATTPSRSASTPTRHAGSSSAPSVTPSHSSSTSTETSAASTRISAPPSHSAPTRSHSSSSTPVDSGSPAAASDPATVDPSASQSDSSSTDATPEPSPSDSSTTPPTD